jgi:hypothetical protein
MQNASIVTLPCILPCIDGLILHVFAARDDCHVQVYETPKRGPGFTDLPQPVRRRQYEAIRPAPKDLPQRPPPIFDQIEVHISVTPEDEERGALPAVS